MKKNNTLKILIILFVSLVVIILAFGIGSVFVPLNEQFWIIADRLFKHGAEGNYQATNATIMTTIRMPRALLAFLVGGGLAIAGVSTQSILQNPLASPYTLGVSSGASLGASLITVLEISIPALGVFLLPAGGFVTGLLTVLFVMAASYRIDRNVKSHTVVLMGMVVSMFVNAIITLLAVLFIKHEHHIISWTLGSFNGKRWYHVLILLAADLIAIIFMLRAHRELDALSFGDEHARALGVDTAKFKWQQLIFAALLTGISVCFTGTIGFVDLIAPHVARKIVGANHKYVIITAFFVGGILMCTADLVSRTILAPREIPVGAVTALIGAPFFVWLYFGQRSKK
ncbi:MAG: iron ABC transporter permease [Lachnospiraceae bacterium]|nr:iron ABC transporter permease [Lachnospiraceae bacterium]